MQLGQCFALVEIHNKVDDVDARAGHQHRGHCTEASSCRQSLLRAGRHGSNDFVVTSPAPQYAACVCVRQTRRDCWDLPPMALTSAILTVRSSTCKGVEHEHCPGRKDHLRSLLAQRTQPGGGGLPLPRLGGAVDVGRRRLGRRHTQPTAPLWMLTQPVQPSAHQLHGDALAVAVGGVEDVAGHQLDGLDHAPGLCR